MITKEKLAIYEQFSGDGDGWARCGTPHEKAVMSDPDWYEILDIVVRLHSVQTGRAAPEFVDETRRRISESIPDAEAVATLMRIAPRMYERQMA